MGSRGGSCGLTRSCGCRRERVADAFVFLMSYVGIGRKNLLNNGKACVLVETVVFDGCIGHGHW